MVPSNKVPPLLTLLYLIAKHDWKKCELGGGQRFVPTGRKVEGYTTTVYHKGENGLACKKVVKLSLRH